MLRNVLFAISSLTPTRTVFSCFACELPVIGGSLGEAGSRLTPGQGCQMEVGYLTRPFPSASSFRQRPLTHDISRRHRNPTTPYCNSAPRTMTHVIIALTDRKAASILRTKALSMIMQVVEGRSGTWPVSRKIAGIIGPVCHPYGIRE